MKNLTTNVCSFEDLIQGNFLYVDKTDYIWHLIDPPGESYFLSRPRRFGKSLLLSTLKAIFEGKRELFRGLALYDKPYDWKPYPIIHLGFADYSPMKNTAEKVDAYLLDKVATIAEAHSISLPSGCDASTAFGKLIDAMAAKGPIVILVDEYDKPVFENTTNAEHGNDIFRLMQDFYGVIKYCQHHVRLAFLTGVSKFAIADHLLGGLNNLTDITLDSDYAGMLGFTEAEVRRCFADRIIDAAKAHGTSEEKLMRDLLAWYDGYRFSKAETHVCNPVSITRFFYSGYDFSNYWDSTGTPRFLLEMMRSQSYSLEAALNGTYDESVFAAYELDRLDITGLLWQTGYLTIKELVPGLRRMKYRLGFPDYEVEDTFMTRLLEHFCDIPQGTCEDTMEGFQNAIAKDDLEGFMALFQSFLANIPYGIHLKHEKYYQTVFFVFFRLLGLFIKAESCTNQGRIDAFVRTAKTVFIFEFKLDKSPEEAVGQILDRRYYEKFQGCGLPIRLIGVNFDSAKGRIDGWEEGTLSEG